MDFDRCGKHGAVSAVSTNWIDVALLSLKIYYENVGQHRSNLLRQRKQR